MSTQPSVAASTLRVGAALQWAEQDLGGPLVENESNIATSVVASVAIQGNGDRVGLVFVNNGSSDLLIGLQPNISATVGIRLVANGGAISMNVRDDFTLPSRQWYVIAVSGTPQLYVLELSRFTKTAPL
jgi:hypothetical protein